MEQNASISLEPYSKFEFPWTAQEFDTPRLVARIKRTSSTDSGRLSKYEAPDGTRILWKIFSDNGDAGTLTMHLLRDSWGLFKDLCLKHWVELVMGMPSMPIALFESYNNRLGYSLYSYLCRFPHEIVKYRYVATKARLIDRFLYATIDNALCCVEEGKPFSDLHVEVPFITLPLKSLLFQPDKDILRRLSVLEARYKRYRTGAGMAHGRIFPTDTELFTSLMAESAVTVARKMTQDTLQEFWKISYDSIVKADRHLEQLGGRWNTLFHEAEEIAAAGELKASLTALAKELYYIRNFFSLSAILGGMSIAGIEPEPEFMDFVDSGGNHRRYRLKLHMEPSLPFLYPFIKDMRRGNNAAIKGIFSFILYGQFLQRLIA